MPEPIATPASGGKQTPSGTPDPANPNPTPNEPVKDTVSYETHKKLLGEKKAIQERLDTLEKEKNEQIKNELAAKEDYKKLLDLEKAERAKEKAELSGIKDSLANGTKMRAFLDKVNGNLSEEYWPLVDVSQIVINPDTGLPDEASAQKVAAEFEKKYPLVLQTKGAAPKLPNNAPQGVGTEISYEEWLKLPVKEMKARMADVIAADKRKK